MLLIVGLATDGFPPFQDFIRLCHLTTIASCQGKGFIPWETPIHSLSQTPVIHSYHAPFSLLARYPNLSSINSPSRYQSTSSAVYKLSDYQRILLHRPSLQSCCSQSSPHQRTPSIFSSTTLITSHNCLIHAFRTLFILLIPRRPLRLFICIARI